MQQHISIASIVVLTWMVAFLLMSLGSKRISLLMLAATFIFPIAGVTVLLLSRFLHINAVWAILMLIVSFVVLGYFRVEFPQTAGLNNDDYIRSIEMSNEVLDIIKHKEDKSEWDLDWVGDGVPIEMPEKITKQQQTINRIIYYFEHKIKHHFILAYNYLKWGFGVGGELKFYSEIYGPPDPSSLQHKTSVEVCNDIKILANKMDPIDKFKPIYLMSVGLFYAISYFIAEDLSGWGWVHFLWSTGLLISLAVLFQKLIRKYIGGTNAHYQLFKKYLDKLFLSSKIIGFTMDGGKKIVLKAIEYSPADVGEGLIQQVDGVPYLVIERNMSLPTLLKVISIVLDEEKFEGWLKLFGSVNVD